MKANGTTQIDADNSLQTNRRDGNDECSTIFHLPRAEMRAWSGIHILGVALPCRKTFKKLEAKYQMERNNVESTRNPRGNSSPRIYY